LHKHTHKHTHTHTHIHTHTHTYAHTHRHTHTHIHTQTHTHTHTQAHTHTHTYTHTHIRTHRHTHTHTLLPSKKKFKASLWGWNLVLLLTFAYIIPRDLHSDDVSLGQTVKNVFVNRTDGSLEDFITERFRMRRNNH